MINTIKYIILTLIGIAISIGIMYGMYWIIKTCSYFFFYEAMVQETIREMVRSEYLLSK